MKRKPYRIIFYVLLRFAELIVLLLPYRAAQSLGAALGGMSYYLLKGGRDIALGNLRRAFAGEKDEAEIRRIARGVFRNFGMSGAEILSMRKLTARSIGRLGEFVNRRALDDALAEGKGVIVIGSHFCNWEFGPMFSGLAGYSIAAIGRRIYYHRYNDFLVAARASKGVETLYRDDKHLLRKMLKVLKANRILGIVPDQDVKSVDGVFVNFFGRPAYTPSGPVRIAMLTGAPLLIYYSLRENGVIKIVFEEPFHVTRTGDNERDIIENTQKWTTDLENVIRRHPSYWAWVHRRWKTRPHAKIDSKR